MGLSMSAFPDASRANYDRPTLVLGNKVMLHMFNKHHGSKLSDVKLNEQVKAWVNETAKTNGWTTVRFLSTRVELHRSFDVGLYKTNTGAT